MSQKTVAVFFGGESPEHDVSILTGILAGESLDSERFHALPVYIDPDGRWWTGDALWNRRNYPLKPDVMKQLENVQLRMGRIAGETRREGGILETTATIGGLFRSKTKPFHFDIALPAFHGLKGEDGAFQGLMEMADIPYAGPRQLAAAGLMDKAFAKQVLRGLGLAVLDDIVIWRPHDAASDIRDQLTGVTYPVCVKPCNLGSSIGVSCARDEDALVTALRGIFRIDTAALIEPFVENLCEYNISVSTHNGQPRLSAIERPIKSGDTLNFKDKYMVEELGGKLGIPTEGMANCPRELTPPELTATQTAQIQDTALKAYAAFRTSGVVRFDFLCNSETGELWLNEGNLIPGSFSYYLWEPAAPPVGFTALLSEMLDEAVHLFQSSRRSIDARSSGAAIF